MSVVTVENLFLKRKKEVILNDIQFSLGTGEVMLLTGVAASGKSLLLKIMAQIIKNYSGKIVYAPEIKKQKLLGYLPEEYKLDLNLTAREFAVEYLILNSRLPASDVVMELVRIFTQFDALELLKKPIRFLSFSQQKQFLLILLLCTQPKLLLLDSPINEDTNISMEFFNKYIHFLKKHQISAIIASKIRDIVSVEYDKLLLLHKGWTVFSATRVQIEQQLEGYVVRLIPANLEKTIPKMEGIQHKIYMSEYDSLDLMLKPSVQPNKFLIQLLNKQFEFDHLEIFKPTIKLFLKYKLEEFNIVETND
ncbi:MAG: hypothetical protein Kow00108_23150 [Calditrichia bacterium]